MLVQPVYLERVEYRCEVSEFVSYEVDPADSCVGVGCGKSREIRGWVLPKANRSFVSG